MSPEEVQKGLEMHKEHDEVRFDNLTTAMQEMKQSIKEFRQDQIRMSELIKKQGDKLDGITKFFEGLSFAQKALMVCAGVVGGTLIVGGGLKTIIGWFLPK